MPIESLYFRANNLNESIRITFTITHLLCFDLNSPIRIAMATERKVIEDIILDQDTLANLRELDNSDSLITVFEELSAMFINNTPKRIHFMEKCINGNDIEKAQAEAHSLRSSAAHLGANNLSKLCQELEDSKDIHPATLQELISKMKTEFKLVKRALEQEIKKVA